MTTPQYQYVESTGLIVPDTSSTLAEVQSEFQQALGADLIVDPATPQGVLITAEAIARNAVINNNAALANQINPNTAGGVFLDAILALTGIQRNVQQPTTVTNVTVTGVAGTTIPIGSQAATSAGDVFQTTSAVTIPFSGTTMVNFQSVAFGAIPCAGDALNTIVSAVLGWETVDNNPASTPASVTTLGSTAQSDQAVRAYRQNTLAFQGIALAEAITSALYAVPGVQSLTFQENVAATTQTINGISMVSHSIYACVNGGTDTDVAAALLENKSSGCAWNGGTTVDVVEPASGQTYAVQFDRPTPVGILINITVSGAATDAVVKAILDYQAGQVIAPDGTNAGFSGFVVGGDVSPFEIAAAVAVENPGAYVSSVTLSLSTGSPSFSTDPIPIGVNKIANTQESYINVTIG